MKKQIIQRIIKVICFMLVLVTAIIASSYILAPKDNTSESGISNPNANGFYSEPKNTIDIAIVGNSDAYSGFSPLELWKEYGYTSYVSAEGRQVMSQSLSQLKKILTCQTPKLVIVETDGIFTKDDFSASVAGLVTASLGVPFSVFQNHNRWKTAKINEMLKKPKYTAHCATKGQMMSNKVQPYNGGEYMIESDRHAKIPFASYTALDSIVRLCISKNIQLLFVELPSGNSWNYPKHNSVKKYADKNEIPFLDLNIDRDSFDLDWKTDTRDKGNHLNSRGAAKATRHIGEYLKNNYDLTDHREDKKYDRWNKDLKQYLELIKL